ncbi:hypothetical protein F5B20DRAFT_454221 [Whalleya microplaca]|nr:hypothetical protein F5B20DRAFT_454221 [Whalleya microplaca]
MRRIRGPLRAWFLAAVLATASASSIRPSMILSRDDTCAADFTKCSQDGLPDNFCCEKGKNCLVLAGKTTVLCCPDTSDCATIGPVTCNLSLQDPVANPKAEIKTTVLDGKLSTCGTGCCPYGYTCDGHNCVMDKDQTKKPDGSGGSQPSPTSTTATTASSTPSSTSSEAPSSTNTTGGITNAAPSTDGSTASAAPGTNTMAIVGGVVGGVVGLCLIVIAIVVLRLRRKRRSQERPDSTISFGNIISNPVPHAEYPNQRLDFLAKTAKGSTAASTPTMVHQDKDFGRGQSGRFFAPNSPYSPYARRPDSEMSDAPRSYHPSAEIGGLRSLTDPFHLRPFSGGGRPLTPTRERRQHSAGSESINIFADPETVSSGRRDTVATTWSGIQSKADRMPETPSPLPPRR